MLRLGAALEEDRGTGIRKLLANGMRTCGGWRTRCRNGGTQGSRVHTVVIPRRCPILSRLEKNRCGSALPL